VELALSDHDTTDATPPVDLDTHRHRPAAPDLRPIDRGQERPARVRQVLEPLREA
jgi:hypothetical protein